MSKKPKTTQPVQIQKNNDPTTEDIYCDAIDEAGTRLMKAVKDIREERCKNEVMRRVMEEMRGRMEEYESKVKLYEKVQTDRTINKEKISNRINKIFARRDEEDENDMKEMMIKYEEELRREYRI